MKTLDDLRDTDLKSILSTLGFTPDADDKRQFKKEGQRVSVSKCGLKWFDHSNRRGGGGAIDLVMHLNSCDFNQAKVWLGGTDLSNFKSADVNNKIIESFVPARNDDNLPYIIDYLTLQRGLDLKIIEYCIKNNYLFADEFKNCVFTYGNGAELRGILGKKWNRCYGKLDKPFYISGKKEQGRVVMCESAIDALSYRQLHPHTPVFSTAGCQRYSLISQIIKFSKQHNLKLMCAFDNDLDADKSYLKICEDNPDLKIGRLLASNKDWNLDLTLK